MSNKSEEDIRNEVLNLPELLLGNLIQKGLKYDELVKLMLDRLHDEFNKGYYGVPCKSEVEVWSEVAKMPGYSSREGDQSKMSDGVKPYKDTILQLLKDSGDLIVALQSRHELLFDKSFPWHLVHKLGATGLKARDLLDPHDISDLTNDLEMTKSMKRAMGRE